MVGKTLYMEAKVFSVTPKRPKISKNKLYECKDIKSEEKHVLKLWIKKRPYFPIFFFTDISG